MNSKEKIKLLKEFIEDLGDGMKNISSLPRELKAMVAIKSNILQTTNVGGALTYMQELEREERDEEITQIQNKQTKILEEQKIFTKILALATLLLGITAFFNFFEITFLVDEIGFFYYLFKGFVILGVIILMIVFVLLINESIKLLDNKK